MDHLTRKALQIDALALITWDEHIEPVGISNGTILLDRRILGQILLELGVEIVDVQIISIGDSMLSREGKQPISVIDNNLVGHVKMAIGIFENRMKGLSDAMRFYLCQPRLILRSTTLQCEFFQKI